jgi:hypothetical protein
VCKKDVLMQVYVNTFCGRGKSLGAHIIFFFEKNEKKGKPLIPFALAFLYPAAEIKSSSKPEGMGLTIP